MDPYSVTEERKRLRSEVSGFDDMITAGEMIHPACGHMDNRPWQSVADLGIFMLALLFVRINSAGGIHAACAAFFPQVAFVFAIFCS